jgi:predicted dehydrogenase
MSAPSPDPADRDYALVGKKAAEIAAPELPYRPPMPKNRTIGVGLVGAGGISAGHLGAYRAYELNVLAIASRDISRAEARRDAYFPDALATDNLERLLGDPAIKVLDIATHPDVRVELMRRALAAGKHVLSQKPFVTDLATGTALIEEAARRGVKLAVNQNGRWAPHLAYMREAVKAGLVGVVTGVHVAIHWDHNWISGSPFDLVEDVILWDFGIHWFDFLVSLIGESATSVRATRAFAQGQTARPPLLAEALVAFPGGQASLIFDGATKFGALDTTSVIGLAGALSSSGPNLGEQSLTLTTAAGIARPRLKGTWFNDGFAGAMGELLSAIEDDREPLNSAKGNLATIRLCQAAIRAAHSGGAVAVAKANK